MTALITVVYKILSLLLVDIEHVTSWLTLSTILVLFHRWEKKTQPCELEYCKSYVERKVSPLILNINATNLRSSNLSKENIDF